MCHITPIPSGKKLWKPPEVKSVTVDAGFGVSLTVVGGEKEGKGWKDGTVPGVNLLPGWEAAVRACTVDIAIWCVVRVAGRGCTYPLLLPRTDWQLWPHADDPP